MIEEEIVRHLKILRVGANLSQDELGKKVGLTRQTINAIERKRKQISRTQAIAILRVVEDSEYTKKILGPVDI